MPTYEFRCPDGTVIERIFKMSEVPDEIPLPDGSGVATRMISGGAGLLFKGTGFYITDYGKDGKKDQRTAAASASSSAPSDAAGGGEAAAPKSDAKVETKPESTTAAAPETKAEPKAESKPATPKSTE